MDLTPTDLLWNFSDPGWAKSAYSNVYAPWLAGACVFVHSHPTFEPELVLMVM
jgi:medium-chain acyl-CoA synthetase